jgi:hypothetical protein
MIIQFPAPTVLFQCKECKLFNKCLDGQRNPEAGSCNRATPAAGVAVQLSELGKMLDRRESLTIPVKE